MLSSFDLSFDLSEELNATVLKKTEITDSDSSLKLYIPTIMANIKKGTPDVSILTTNGKGVFKNANKKPALTSNKLYEKNYMEASINKDSNSGDIDSAVNMVTSYIKSSIDSSVHNISTKNVKYTINKGSTVRACFLNGKTSKLSYSLTNESSTTKKLK